MKVSTDAVLLGAWVEVNSYDRILDIGTGTGIIAIMMAQKTSAIIDAIDIDAPTVKQARENVNGCPWCDCIRIHHIALQNFIQDNHAEHYNLIVSNPPYFSDAHRDASEARRKARHSDHSLTFDDLINGVNFLLKREGAFNVIMPFKEGMKFRKKAAEKGLYCEKMTRVVTRLGKPQKRVLMKLSKKLAECREDELVIQNADHSYTKEFMDLTKEYYLPKTHRH